MKKMLIVCLSLILLMGGFFIWKGGHHAIFLYDVLEDWLGEDTADQTLTVRIGDSVLKSDSFWTEYGERRIYGLSSEGYTAYLLDGILYMDTGNAYSLPRDVIEKDQIRKLAAALILNGRITKDGDIYHLNMERDDLSLAADITAVGGFQSLALNAEYSGDDVPVSIQAALTAKTAAAHPIPKEVTDAIVRAAMDPPMSLTEPLEMLLPALKSLLPLYADVTLGVECGILSISETISLTAENGSIYLIRNGKQLPLELPGDVTDIDPMMICFAMLRNGSFQRSGDDVQFRMDMPPDATAELTAQLVPQIRDLGLTFEESAVTLWICGGKLTHADLRARGSIPFLITTIPLTFTAIFEIT